MKSMTGYGSGSACQDNLEIFVEITSVNRRNFEVNVSLPRELLSLEHSITELARTSIGRGKVNIYLKATDFSNAAGLSFDEEILDSVLHKLKNYSKKNNIAFNATPELIFDIVKTLDKPTQLELKNSIEQIVLQATTIALQNIDLMRTAEGEALAQDIHQRLNILLDNIAFIATKSTDSVMHYREQLFQKLEQAKLNIDLNDERILKEIALFADRCDISEELTRLKSHIDQFINDLSTPIPTGRKMDFLCQEINRELNTIGSKSNLIEVSHKVIDCKNELERIREQVQNIE